MFEFIARLFAPKPPVKRPMAIRRKRINPVYLLNPERGDHLVGKIGTRITGEVRGNDVSATQYAHHDSVSIPRPEL